MVHVNLHTLWLNVASDPSQRANYPLMSALSVTTTQPGEVRRYASGRLRSVRQVGSARQAVASLLALEPAEVRWLERQQGQTLCIRDDRGRKLWGVYYSLIVEEHRYNGSSDVTLTLSEVSLTEGVFT